MWSRGESRCQLAMQVTAASSLQSTALQNSTRKAETFLWGLAEAARGSDGGDICRVLFSRPRGTDSAGTWGHLECGGGKAKTEEGGLILFLPITSDQRLVGTAGRTHQCLLPASQFQRAGSGDKGLLPAPSSAQGAESSLSKHLLTSAEFPRQRN